MALFLPPQKARVLNLKMSSQEMIPSELGIFPAPPESSQASWLLRWWISSLCFLIVCIRFYLGVSRYIQKILFESCFRTAFFPQCHHLAGALIVNFTLLMWQIVKTSQNTSQGTVIKTYMIIYGSSPCQAQIFPRVGTSCTACRGDGGCGVLQLDLDASWKSAATLEEPLCHLEHLPWLLGWRSFWNNHSSLLVSTWCSCLLPPPPPQQCVSHSKRTLNHLYSSETVMSV